MPGEFHLSGFSNQLTMGSPTAEQLAALVGLEIVLKSNIPRGQAIPTSGGLFYVPQRTVTVLPSGQISENGTDNGIMLLADDPALGLDNPVQWDVIPGRVSLGGRSIKLASWTFTAPAPGVSRTLDQLAPVPNITAVPVGKLGIDQITGPTSFGLSIITAADAAAINALLGDNPAMSGATPLTTTAAPTSGQITRYDATAGALAVTLPALSGLTGGALYGVQKYQGDLSANTITFTAAGSDKFDDTTTTTETLRLTGQLRFLQVFKVGATKYWKVVNGNTTLGSLDARYQAAVIPTAATGAAIVAAANSFGGNPGIVLLKSGATYVLNVNADQIVLPSNITLVLNGATIKYTGGTAGPLVTNSDTTNGNKNISIVGPGLIDGGNTDHSGVYGCFKFNKVKYLTISNLEITNAFRGIQLLGDQHTNSRYVTLSNLDIHDCAQAGVQVSNGYRQVQHRNVTVHDCVGDSSGGISDIVQAAYIIDASEQDVSGCTAYGNAGSGIAIRNVFGCTFNDMTAKRNGFHGIHAVGVVDSVGANWLSTTNSNASLGTYDDIHFSATDLGYGVSKATTITGVRCGPLQAVGAAGAAWLDTAHPALSDALQEGYALYIEDGVGTAGGDLRLLGVQAFAGRTGQIRLPATLGKVVVSIGTEAWDSAPSTINVLGVSAPKIQSSFATQVFQGSTQLTYNCYITNAGVQNAYIEWDVALTPGAWYLDLLYLDGTNSGIYTVTVNGAALGTIDGYNATGGAAHAGRLGDS
jgi:hypothetical protein